jgi:phenylalanyl-tRNA synthetase beta chain
MRPISAVVDATNYVMLETGQPLHAFDLDTLKGGVICARRSRAGESIVTLDGERHDLEEGTLVIADAEGPVAVAGVMGGGQTEVTAATKNLLLESAYFAPLPVRRVSQKLRLRTEAAVRFEKGVDPRPKPLSWSAWLK